LTRFIDSGRNYQRILHGLINTKIYSAQQLGGAMLKKTSRILLKHWCLLSFLVLISATLFIGSGATPAQAANKADALKGLASLVDINSATQKELENIKGVGAATAKKIIAGRPYTSVDELSKAGLSAKAVEALKPLVTVGKGQAAPLTATMAKAPASAADLTKATQDIKTTAQSSAAATATLAPGTKININTADKATLQTLPDIGPVKAQAIIAGRPYKSVEDVMKISGIKERTFAAIKNYITVK
jgi:competence ComEA-like helix-hairpin-helix protein